jgi:predicted site-specific integrase-resolvase
MSKKITWIDEKQAAERMGYQPETLRRYCKSGKLPISFTSVKGRSFKYSEKDIENFLFENATIIS